MYLTYVCIYFFTFIFINIQKKDNEIFLHKKKDLRVYISVATAIGHFENTINKQISQVKQFNFF